jgi:hypothetical protein
VQLVEDREMASGGPAQGKRPVMPRTVAQSALNLAGLAGEYANLLLFPQAVKVRIYAR